MENLNANKPLLVVWSLVYNHESYLNDYFEGIIMQKTDFPFVAIVHDDCSTDGSAAIIKDYAEKYPDIIKPIFETENQYSKKDGALDRIMRDAIEATGAKYVAMCEGDDYWTDPLKLQKQVDFLESHPDYGMCYTKAQVYYQNKRKFGQIIGEDIFSIKDLLYYNSIPTLTSIVRADILRAYSQCNPILNKKLSLGDYPLWLYIFTQMKWKFLNETTGVYRFLLGSASKPKSIESIIKFNDDVMDISLYYMNKLGIKDRLVEQKIFNRRYIGIASSAVLEGHRKLAKENYALAQNKTFVMKFKEFLCSNDLLFKILTCLHHEK